MTDVQRMHAGDAIRKTLTFTLTVGETASRVTMLLARTDARSEHPTIGRCRSIVLQAVEPAPPSVPDSSGSAGAVPRTSYTTELNGVIPPSICGGDYVPVFCVFEYADGRPATGFEIDADQRFSIGVADDASAIDAGPAIVKVA